MLVEDHIHRAFSLIIEARQKGESLEFEGQSFAAARGPLNNQGQYDLSGVCGLLGHGHPVITKSHLYLALKATQGHSVEDSNGFLKSTHQNLSKLIGLDIVLVPHGQALTLNIGRGTSFLNNEALDHIKNGCSISLLNLFGVPAAFALKGDANSNSSTNRFLSFQDIYLLSEVTRFLALGQFYGDNGLIKKREELLITKFKGVQSVEHVDGLEIKMKKVISNNQVLTLKDKLVFPLSFDEALVDKVIEILMENKCI